MRINFDKEIGKCPNCEGEEISWQVTNHHNDGIIVDLRCMNFDCGHGWRFTENNKEIVSECEANYVKYPKEIPKDMTRDEFRKKIYRRWCPGDFGLKDREGHDCWDCECSECWEEALKDVEFKL